MGLERRPHQPGRDRRPQSRREKGGSPGKPRGHYPRDPCPPRGPGQGARAGARKEGERMKGLRNESQNKGKERMGRAHTHSEQLSNAETEV